DGDIAISLGTAGIAARVASADAQPGPDVEVRPYGDGTVLHVRSRLPGGRLLRSFAEARSVSGATFWSELFRNQGKELPHEVHALLTHFTEVYADAIDALFPGEPKPRRLLLNGGAAQHIPWF